MDPVMALENPLTLLYGCVVAAAFIILAIVTLPYAFRSDSFEDSVKKQVIESAPKGKKDEKKKDKKRQSSGKNKKEKPAEDTVDTSIPEIMPVPEIRHEHVEFKVANEVVPLDEEHDHQLSKRKISANEKPKKPILTNKSSAEVGDQLVADVQDRSSRANSFDVVHPKDEYELIKSHQKNRDQPVSGKKENTAAPVVPDKGKWKEGKKQKAKSGGNPSTPSDSLNAAELIELVRSVALSEEESQVVVNEILNKGNDTWSQKNDPVANLRKSLQERETQLKVEIENKDAMKLRIGELRQELAVEKSHLQATRSQLLQMQQELQKSQAAQRLLADNHRSELQVLQAKVLSDCNAKAAAALNRLQEDNNRLKDLVKKLEFDRSAFDAIPHLQRELEQLRSERQQKEMTVSQLKQQNEEVVREANSLKEQVKLMTSDRQQEEYALQQQVRDLKNSIREREAAEVERISQIGRDLDNSQRQESASRESLSRANSQLEHLTSENKAMEAQLLELKNLHDKQKFELQESQNEVSRLRSSCQHETELRESTEVKLRSLEKEFHEVSQKSQAGNSEDLVELEKKVSLLTNENKVVQEELSKQMRQFEELSKERESSLKCLSSCGLQIDGEKGKLAEAVELVVEDLKSKTSRKAQELEELRSRNQELEQQISVQNLSTKQTEAAMKESCSSELQVLEQKLDSERVKREEVEAANSRLVKESQSLKETISGLESIQGTVTDMENKLKDLQSKLRGEESAKRDLSVKLDEVRLARDANAEVREASSRALSLQQECDMVASQLQDLKDDKADVQEIRSKLEELQQQLDRERKSVKELQTQNVKLKSLVKIGEDSLRAEMKRTDELLTQLKLKNGSAVSTPCLTTNGSNNDKDSVMSSISSTSLNREQGSNGNQP